jgi:hypothetical protein
MEEIWAKIPIRVLRDKGLRLNDLRVYGAVSSFQGRNGSAYPGRKAIAERSGVAVSHISECTRRLEAGGYLKKTQRGKKCTNLYVIVRDGPESGHRDGPESGSSIVKEHRKEKGQSWKEVRNSRGGLPPLEETGRSYM